MFADYELNPICELDRNFLDLACVIHTMAMYYLARLVVL